MFLVRDSAGVTNMGFGNPVRNGCAFCHNMQHTGMDVAPGQVDIGISNLPWALPSDRMPLFKLTCLDALRSASRTWEVSSTRRIPVLRSPPANASISAKSRRNRCVGLLPARRAFQTVRRTRCVRWSTITSGAITSAYRSRIRWGSDQPDERAVRGRIALCIALAAAVLVQAQAQERSAGVFCRLPDLPRYGSGSQFGLLARG